MTCSGCILPLAHDNCDRTYDHELEKLLKKICIDAFALLLLLLLFLFPGHEPDLIQ